MSRVLVTGGAGFIGVHLVRRLLDDGDEVVVLDNMKRVRPETRARLALLANGSRVRVVEGDIRDASVVSTAMQGCDVVYHLAAQSNVMGAVDQATYSVTTNVLGTFVVLACAAEQRVGNVVFTSSREVYGEAISLPVPEDAPLRAKNHYGASKVAGEAYCHTFANLHGLPVQILRFANVYGPGDSGRVIPLWIDAAREGRDLTVYGGEQVIDFLWVGTAVDALRYAARERLPGPINVGSGKATRILDLAERIRAATKTRSQVVRVPARELEVAKFVADITRYRALGLTPEEDPLQHLEEMVAIDG